MALNTVSSDRLSTNVKNTNFTAAEKQDLTDDILPLAGQIGNRNLIINGAMQVAQRGTSSTTNGYGTVDRFRVAHANTDEAPTQEQVDVASGTTPYTLGFRKAFKLTNGNQTSGAGTSDIIYMLYTIEAQDVVNSGWNLLSSSSDITLSFWVKSSVSQNFFGNLISLDGTAQGFTYETGTLTANTWTKITKTIPGNSNIQINNDNGGGLLLEFLIFRGTAQTGSVTLNQWRTYDSSVRNPDMASTWYTTNDATFEITGVQLEVGSVATDFEHRSFGQELDLCRRYFQQISPSTTDGVIALGNSWSSTLNKFVMYFNPNMRAIPTLNVNGTVRVRNASGSTQLHSGASITLDEATTSVAQCRATNTQGGLTAGNVGQVRLFGGTTEALQFTAEL